MRPPDARQHPSGRVSGARGQRSQDGASVGFMELVAVIHLARIIRPGGTVCGRGNGSRPGQRSTNWCARPERSSACCLAAGRKSYDVVAWRVRNALTTLLHYTSRTGDLRREQPRCPFLHGDTLASNGAGMDHPLPQPAWQNRMAHH